MPSSAPASTVRGCLGWTAKPNTRLSAHNPVLTCRQLSPPSALTHAPVPMVPAQILKLSAMAVSSPTPSSGSRLPPGMRNVDHDIIGAGPFHLKIAMAAGRHLHIEPWLFFQPLAPRAFQHRRSLVEVFDLEAEMMNAAVIGSIGANIGGFFSLPIQDRQIDIAVGQKDCAVRGPPNFLHSKGFLVKVSHLCGLPGGQRNVFDARHRFPPRLFLYAACACSRLRARPRLYAIWHLTASANSP